MSHFTTLPSKLEVTNNADVLSQTSPTVLTLPRITKVRHRLVDQSSWQTNISNFALFNANNVSTTTPSTMINDSTTNNLATFRISQVKLGLAAAMFFSVLLACGLPLALLVCLQMRTNANRAEKLMNDNDDDDDEEEEEEEEEDEEIEIFAQQDWEDKTQLDSRWQNNNKKIKTESAFNSTLSNKKDYRQPVNSSAGASNSRQFSRSASTSKILNKKSGQNVVEQSKAITNREIVDDGYRVPEQTNRRRTRQLLRRWTGRLSCFAAGVFLSTGFMDLLPDVQEAMEDAKQHLKIHTDYPLSAFVSLIGFFFVLSIEQIILGCKEIRQRKEQKRQAKESANQKRLSNAGHVNHDNYKHQSVQVDPTDLSNEDLKKTQYSPGSLRKFSISTVFSDVGEIGNNKENLVDLDDDAPAYMEYYRENSNSKAGSRSHVYAEGHGISDESILPYSSVTGLTTPPILNNYDFHANSTVQRNSFHWHPNSAAANAPDKQPYEKTVYKQKHFKTTTSSAFRVLILVTAMSLHAVFEGLAVGLQTTVERTIALFSALSLHKLIIAAGIGVNLANAHTENSDNNHASSHADSHAVEGHSHDHGGLLTGHGHGDDNTDKASAKRELMSKALVVVLFAGASPLGVLIGWWLMLQPRSAALVMSTAVLQGLACGTFFYVVFCELLPEEFKEDAKDRLGKLITLLLGFVLIAVYLYFAPG